MEDLVWILFGFDVYCGGRFVVFNWLFDDDCEWCVCENIVMYGVEECWGVL